MSPKEISEFIRELLRDHAGAQAFIADAMAVLMLWDDLVDGKAGINVHRVDDALWTALASLPENPFYREYFEQLHPAMKLAVMQWMGAARIERDPEASDDDLAIAWAFSQPWATLILACSIIINGPGATATMTPRIYRVTSMKPFSQYLEELGARARQPEAKQ